MNKYEISLWEDIPSKTSDGIPFLKEQKLCVIGSDTMTSQIRAIDPKMVENINGTHTFTFKMFYNYYDEYTGEKFPNPFKDLLINERKIKVFWKDDWYDLVIKNIDEDSSTNSATYTCKDLFITELSKNGYNIELTSDLQNNSGTAGELAQMVLDGSGWQFDDKGSTKIYQYKEEPVYELTLVNRMVVRKISLTGVEKNVTLTSGQKVLIFKSSIDQVPDDAVNFEAEIHLLYTANKSAFSTDTNEMLVNNGSEGYFIGKVSALSNDRSFKIEVNGVNLFEVSNNKLSTKYRGKGLVKSQKTVYDKVFERYVNVYKDDSDNIVYGFSSTEFSNPLNVINIIANSNDFTSVNGWQGENLTWTVDPSFNDESVSSLDIYNSKGYLRLQSGTYYNSGLTANLSYFTPSQSDLKTGEIGGFNKGEKYVFRVKAKSIGTGNSVGNYILDTSKFQFDVKKFNNNDRSQYIGDSYFTLEDSFINGNWIEYIYKCTTSCSPKKLEELGLYITANGSCWIEEVQFFRYITGVNNDTEVRINPGDSQLQGLARQVYKYYMPDESITEPEDVEFLYKGEEKQGTIYIPQTTYEKITTVEAKGSNRFNILQSIAENFECWVQFIIEHDSEGYTLLNSETNLPEKKVRLVETIGTDLGWSFVYGIDLKNIKRKIISEDITTKVIVLPNNNEFGKNGFCTIARSQLNYPRETFVLNLDYYVNQGLLNRRELDLDLYSNSDNYIGYYYNLNKFNTRYDTISDSLNQLKNDLLRQQSEANALNERLQATIAQKQETESDIMRLSSTTTLTAALEYAKNHQDFDQLRGLVELLGQSNTQIFLWQVQLDSLNNSINRLNVQINESTELQTSLIQSIKELHEAFFKKYSRYIQEGTWQDENYIDDNQYYLDSLQVAYTSSRPQLQYDINIIRLNYLDEYSSKKFNVGDVCYIEDKEFFNYQTEDGTPYKLKIIISEITSYFDTPEKDTIKVQNYKTQFDDLFQRIVATTQSLQYAQGSYAKAASVINQDKTFNFDLLQETFDYNTNLVLNASNQDVTWGPDGITIKDSTNSACWLRIMSGGLFITNDGGVTWKNAIRGDGISTNLLTAGRINAGEIYIYSGDTPTFRWDEKGINAYKYSDGVVDHNTFVRFDQYGIYGITNNSENFTPTNIQNIEQNASFGLTWNGFFMKAVDGNGSVIINSNDVDGAVIKVTKNNENTFYIKDNGNVMLKGEIYATSGEFSGKVIANTGRIGNWYIDNGNTGALYYNNNEGIDVSNPGLEIDYQTANGKKFIFKKTTLSEDLIKILSIPQGYDIAMPFNPRGSKRVDRDLIKSVANQTGTTTYEIDDQSGDIICTFTVIVTTDTRKSIVLSPLNDEGHEISIAGSPEKIDWRITVGDKFGVDALGNVFMGGGTINANEVVFQASTQDGKGGGFRCATGEDGTTTTYGAMMYGWPSDGNINNVSNYFIATNGGVRMQSGGPEGRSFYCSNIIHASEAISIGSDRKIKNTISYNLEDYVTMFTHLKPAFYHFNINDSNRFHVGYVAQDVEEAILAAGLTTQDFAGLIKQPVIDSNNNIIDYNYLLRYSEFIPLNTYMIQKLLKRIEDLEEKIKTLE